MKQSNFWLKKIKRISSNRLINPIVLRVASAFSNIISNDILFRVPIVGNIKFSYDFDSNPFLMFSSGDDSIIAEHYFSLLGFEPESLKIFLHLSKKSINILDVGANTGVYSLAAGVNNLEANIYSFEPVPKIFERLNYNIELNKLTNIYSEPLMLSHENGVQKIYLPEGTITTSASSAKNFRPCKDAIQVDALTLDTFIKLHRLQSIDLIKIDTESTEPFVLEGAIQTIEKMRPIILCEVLHGLTEVQIHQIMDTLNYYYFWIKKDGLVEMKKIIGDPSYEFRNYLFVPKEKKYMLEEFIYMP